MRHSILARRKDILQRQLMVNNSGYILHKVAHKKGKRHDYNIYKKNQPITLKEVVNVFDVGYSGVESDYPEQLSSIPYRKQETMNYLKKKITTLFIQK
ncbi:MAG TPA: hypothetical protein VN704_01020 [Verrucomicrobiae bacterium]|nr:hypothetical protein [Verrucomicrobiae bacterium]